MTETVTNTSNIAQSIVQEAKSGIVETPVRKSPVLDTPVTNTQNVEHEAPVVEEKPVASEETPVVPEDKKFEDKFAALAQKEQKLLEEAKAFKEQQAKMGAEYSDWQDSLKLMETDPIAFIEKYVSYEKLTDYIINGGKGINESESKVKELESKLSKFQEDLKMQEIQKDLNTYFDSICEHVNTNADKYPITVATNSQNEVVKLVADWYDTFKEEISFEDAAQKIEEQLYIMESERIKKLSNIDRFKTEFFKKEEQKQVTKTPTLTKENTIKTLSNNAITGSPNRESPGNTKEQRRARAIELLKNLKQAESQ